MIRYTDVDTDKGRQWQADRQKDWQTGGQTDAGIWQTDGQTYAGIKWQTYGQIHLYNDRQADPGEQWQTERQTDAGIQWQTDRRTIKSDYKDQRLIIIQTISLQNVDEVQCPIYKNKKKKSIKLVALSAHCNYII